MYRKVQKISGGREKEFRADDLLGLMNERLRACVTDKLKTPHKLSLVQLRFFRTGREVAHKYTGVQLTFNLMRAG